MGCEVGFGDVAIMVHCRKASHTLSSQCWHQTKSKISISNKLNFTAIGITSSSCAFHHLQTLCIYLHFNKPTGNTSSYLWQKAISTLMIKFLALYPLGVFVLFSAKI